MISLTSPVKTRAHNWSTGLKFVTLCVATVGLFQLNDLPIHLGILAVVFCCYALLGSVFLFSGLRNLRPIWPFIVIILIWHYFSSDLIDGGVIATRMLNALALANLVTMTTRLDSLMDFLNWLLAPLRYLGLKTRIVSIAVALVIRFTPVLFQKSCYIRASWLARARQKPRWKIILPIVTLVLDDADHVADALRARGGIYATEDKK